MIYIQYVAPGWTQVFSERSLDDVTGLVEVLCDGENWLAVLNFNSTEIVSTFQECITWAMEYIEGMFPEYVGDE